jgi:arabinogalactan endo-1,4-beta-galactosidase
MGSLASPRTSFGNFASIEQQGMQAVADASNDTSIGPALPVPIRCIHITPSYNLSTFFGSANSYSIPYDAMCQSYYPIYHGPLTAAQAAAALRERLRQQRHLVRRNDQQSTAVPDRRQQRPQGAAE